ncbi:hypothetical protein [Ruminococcus flavefaciens]|uniref:hypothetical protein n=1 Tax=Ruminococcus flavefaciens TaxID=1265 RepID=UPI0026EA8CEF|nr:hypothetical protein [Ruminococcus flavefaciens]
MLRLNEYLDAEVYRSEHGIKKMIAKHITPSTNAVYLLRKAQVYHKSNSRIKRILSRVYQIKMERRYALYINLDIEIGLGLRLPHPNGIIIGGGCEIGSNVTIFQQVTIGSRVPGGYINGEQPKIKDDVMLFAGSKVLGDIVVASKTWVGANSVIIENTEEGFSYTGLPAKKSRKKHIEFSY